MHHGYQQDKVKLRKYLLELAFNIFAGNFAKRRSSDDPKVVITHCKKSIFSFHLRLYHKLSRKHFENELAWYQEGRAKYRTKIAKEGSWHFTEKIFFVNWSNGTFKREGTQVAITWDGLINSRFDLEN